MTAAFATYKLGQLEKAITAVLQQRGVNEQAIEKVFTPDPIIVEHLKESDVNPTTKDNYGTYLNYMTRDPSIVAVMMLKCGGNPVGILTALAIKSGTSLSELELQSMSFNEK